MIARCLNDKSQCGKYGQDIFASKPVDLTTSNFHSQIAKSETPVLVDFWADWCGPQSALPKFTMAFQKQVGYIVFKKEVRL